jgi:hypothetical protein
MSYKWPKQHKEELEKKKKIFERDRITQFMQTETHDDIKIINVHFKKQLLAEKT